jgi:hypothetical protein
MQNIAIKVIDRLFIVVYAANPTDAEWSEYMRLVEQHGIDRTMQLIFTDSATPSAAQRRRLEEMLEDRNVPVAVVSASAKVRTLVTAMSWFNRRIRAFQPAAIRDAIAYLEIPASRTELIEREGRKLREELDSNRRATA